MKPEKYQPSNGTEGMSFYCDWCETCVNEGDVEDGEGCEILGRTMVYKVEDSEYPKEWCYDEQGVPCCTAYKPPADENTKKVRELLEGAGQLRLF